jgi:CBS-domain-containing membrane protein
MCDQNVGSIPVVMDQESRKLVGMITDRDLCCSVIADALDPKITAIEKFMTLNPVTCRDAENIENCERLMQEHKIRRMPIVDGDGRVIGIVAQAGFGAQREARPSIEDSCRNLQERVMLTIGRRLRLRDLLGWLAARVSG